MTSKLQKINLWNSYKNEYKNLLKLGFPVLITQLGIIIVGFADTMMVGMYGTQELAAASFVNNFFMVAVVMLIGFASGVTPLVGALHGQKKFFETGQILRVSTQLNVITGLVFTLIMGVLYFFLDKMGQPAELLPLIKDYYLVILLSLLPLAIFNCYQQMANGTTDTAMPMWLMLLMNLMNIMGNYALIFGKFGFAEMGLLGAGISTLVARWTGAFLIVLLVMTRRRYHPYIDGLLMKSPLRNERKKVFHTSYPVMIQSGIETVLWSVGAVVCGWFGAEELAGYQVIVTISQLGFMTYISFGIAASIRVANYIGVNDFTMVRRISSAGLHINLLLGTLASVLFLLFGETMIGGFTEDLSVIATAALLIPPLILYQYMDAVQITYANALRGTSEVKPLLWISIVSYLCIGIPLLFLLAIGFDLKSEGVFYSFSGALLSAAIFLFISFRKAVRRRERVYRKKSE